MQEKSDHLKVRTFRTSDEDILLAKAVARSLGLSTSAFIRQAIRAEAERQLRRKGK